MDVSCDYCCHDDSFLIVAENVFFYSMSDLSLFIGVDSKTTQFQESGVVEKKKSCHWCVSIYVRDVSNERDCANSVGTTCCECDVYP